MFDDVPDVPDDNAISEAVFRDLINQRRESRGVASPYGPMGRPFGQWLVMGIQPLLWLRAEVKYGTVGPFLWTVILLLLAWLVWEHVQGRRRSWRSGGSQLRWDDPIGEWVHSRWQWERTAIAVRWVVVLVLVKVLADFHTFLLMHSGTDDVVGALRAFLPVAVFLYVYRHLPTRSRSGTEWRRCEHCGTTAPGWAPRVCRRCGRVTKMNNRPGVPALRRRLVFP